MPDTWILSPELQHCSMNIIQNKNTCFMVASKAFQKKKQTCASWRDLWSLFWFSAYPYLWEQLIKVNDRLILCSLRYSYRWKMTGPSFPAAQNELLSWYSSKATPRTATKVRYIKVGRKDKGKKNWSLSKVNKNQRLTVTRGKINQIDIL